MLNVEIRVVAQGKEVAIDSFVQAVVRGVRDSVREEIGQSLLKH